MVFGKNRIRPSLNGRKPSVGDNSLVFAIGDVHGRYDLLCRLLDKIESQARRHKRIVPRLIFLGDYVDRGPQSKQVIDFLLNNIPDRLSTTFLMGNHEDMMLKFLDEPDHGYAWCMNGGAETLASYGILRRGEYPGITRFEKIRDLLLKAIPDNHVAFLEGLSHYTIAGDYLFVHAGLRPGVPIEEQSTSDMMWIRDEFLNSEANFGSIIVHGHTPEKNVHVCHNRIGIDTGAFSTGILTSIMLHEDRYEFLQVTR